MILNDKLAYNRCLIPTLEVSGPTTKDRQTEDQLKKEKCGNVAPEQGLEDELNNKRKQQELELEPESVPTPTSNKIREGRKKRKIARRDMSLLKETGKSPKETQLSTEKSTVCKTGSSTVNNVEVQGSKLLYISEDHYEYQVQVNFRNKFSSNDKI